MKYLLAILAIMMLSPSGEAVAKRKKKVEPPYVCGDWPSKDTCFEDDPLGPCPGRLIKVCNPQKKNLWVHIGCGPEVMTNVWGLVIKKRWQFFRIDVDDVPGGLKKGECHVDAWSYKEEDVKDLL